MHQLSLGRFNKSICVAIGLNDLGRLLRTTNRAAETEPLKERTERGHDAARVMLISMTALRKRTRVP